MKGIVAKCLEELVVNKYGKENWEEILKKSDLPIDLKIYSHKNIPDDVILKVINNACSVLDVSFEQIADIFGSYWINDFVSKKYFAFFKPKYSAKDFLLQMNRIHEKMTERIENAKPPHFEFEDVTDNSIVMSYHSERHLEPIWLGIIKGVGEYYNEKLEIIPITKNKVKIIFDS